MTKQSQRQGSGFPIQGLNGTESDIINMEKGEETKKLASQDNLIKIG